MNCNYTNNFKAI